MWVEPQTINLFIVGKQDNAATLIAVSLFYVVEECLIQFSAHASTQTIPNNYELVYQE